MAFKSVFFFILTTELCTIGNFVRAQFDTMYLHDYDTGRYQLPAVSRYTRDLGNLEYTDKRSSARFIPEFLEMWDKLIPGGKNKMEIIKGDLYLPRPSENYSHEEAPPSFAKSEESGPSPGGYVNANKKESYDAANIRPESVLTEGTIALESATPDSYLVRPDGNQIDWKKDGDVQVALNSNSDIYKLTGNINSNFNEEILNVNHLQTDIDSPGDDIHGCYSHCLESCYGASTVPPRSYCESSRQAKPFVININSECLTHPSQRFSHRYNLKPKLNGNGLKFHGAPRKYHGYSSCPFSDIPPYYY